jgi:hypothetical protein
VHACSESWLNNVAVNGMIARPQSGGRSPMPDDPTWRHTTVPVSAQASRMGAQCSSKIDGYPIWCGRSGRVTARKPRSALRRISAAPSSGSESQVIPNGMIRSGCGCHHSSWTQSLNARVVASPSSGSEHCEYTRPQKPVIIDGKLSEAHTPLMSMSRTRASTSKQPGRIWSKRNGSSFTDSGRRPATAFIPTWV